MKTIQFQGRELSAIALGTTAFGSRYSAEQAAEAIDFVRSQGVNVIDTARVYGYNAPGGGFGYSESIIGQYLAGRKDRESLFLVTKGAHPPMEDRAFNRLTEKDLRFDLEQSLRNLKTDYVDLYFLHRDNPQMDMAEVMGTLHDFVKKGYVRAIGASNWRFSRIMEANAYAADHGLTPFTASQIEWSMAKYDESENPGDKTQFAMKPEEIPLYRESGLLVMCYTSQASGLFSKIIAAGPTAAEGYDALKASGGLKKYQDPDNRRRAVAVEQLCAKYNVSPAAIGVAYLTGMGSAVMPILGSSGIAQLADSLSAPDLKLTEEDYRLIEGR